MKISQFHEKLKHSLSIQLAIAALSPILLKGLQAVSNGFCTWTGMANIGQKLAVVFQFIDQFQDIFCVILRVHVNFI